MNDDHTIVLAVPASNEHTASAMDKLLLAIWQCGNKRTWSIWRPRALVSFEYFAQGGTVFLQIHSPVALVRSVCRSLLPALVHGCDLEPPGESELPRFDDGALMTMRLRSPGWVDLPKDGEPTGVDGILRVLAQLPADATAIVQLLLEPTWMTTEDGRQPAFWFAGRIAATPPHAEVAVRLIGSAFGQFAGFNGLRFSRVRSLSPVLAKAIGARRWPRPLLPTEAPATTAQIAMLHHPPAHPVNSALHLASSTRSASAVPTVQLELGEGRDPRGFAQPVGVDSADLVRHGVIVGPSGSGKSTLLARLAEQAMQKGEGLTVVDPHGALARDIARIVPANRLQDAAVIRFSDLDYPVALNPLRARPGYEFLAADDFVEAVQRVYGGEYWGPLIDLVLRHAAMASVELGGSVIDSARLLDDPWYRNSTLKNLSNPETVRILSSLDDRAQERRLLPAINRLQRMLATPWLRNVLGQPERGLDFANVFDERRILLFDLSGVGATNARLLGSLILLLIKQATLGRPGDERNARHLVLVDEASWFVSRTVSELFDQARKFGVGIVLALQRLGQLSSHDVRDAILANAGTLVTFRVHDPDEAHTIAKHFATDRIEVDDIRRLGRFEAYLQVTRDGQRLPPAWLRVQRAVGEPRDDVLKQLIARAREQYARPRAEVEAQLAARERLLLNDDEPEIRFIPPSAVSAYAS